MENDKLLKASDVKEYFKRVIFGADKKIDAWVDSIPAVDAVEVRHGWWLFEEYPDEYYSSKCSLCGFETVEAAYLKGWNFCPNCGARMDGEDGDKDV